MNLEYMKIAIELAEEGIGHVNPNPLVGAVVVKDNKIIGKGFHKSFGGPHAEVHALNEAAEKAKGADIYITLEPCTHHGKTPPCVEKIIDSGIKNCFIGSLDENPLVKGKSIKILEEHGINVKYNILKEECDNLNKIFFKYIRTKLPYIFLKCGITLDGKIATKTGNSKWITNEKAREKVQYYRNKFMGLLIGINTAITDNPTLTARIPNGNDPYRIIVDPHLRITNELNIIKNNHDKKTIVITSKENLEEKRKKLLSLENDFFIKFIFLENYKFSFHDIIEKIGALNIDSILLEGGSSMISLAFKENCIDAGEIFISNKILGDENSIPFIKGFDISNMDDAIKLDDVKFNLYDNNIGVEFDSVKGSD